MPRRKPQSGKQHKEGLKLKRAVKRGDVPAPEHKNVPRLKSRIARRRQPGGTASITADSSRRLQSSFIKMPAEFLQKTRQLASELHLPRPILSEAAIFHEADYEVDATYGRVSCPKRPKWRYDMGKKEVESNEEARFDVWIKETDGVLAKWQNSTPDVFIGVDDHDGKGDRREMLRKMPRSPTYFERNLEVWRQLWRVTEISQILLVLLDSRCPPLHFPPSLVEYISGHKVILVLTKVDIAGPARADAWSNYLQKMHPGVHVVQVKSYVAKEAGEDTQGHQLYEPQLPATFRERLVQALKETHEELLAPSDHTEKSSCRGNPVKKDIDWEALRVAQGDMVGNVVGNAATLKGKEDDEVLEGTEPEFLTVGLIGQPNVGKSSLLNALFGTHKVRASRTPGKTKHFQTLFWTPQVRLVDCPGLIMPSFVPMELQVLAGVLPISTISSVPSCILYASLHLPLENVFNLVHPSSTAPLVVDKRTWREGPRPSPSTDAGTCMTWSAMDILTAYAERNGWVTAKAGRPDVMRAGNAILRALAEGRVGWGFCPEGSTLGHGDDADCGIWIKGVGILDRDEYESNEPETEDEVEVESTDSAVEGNVDGEDGGEEEASTRIREISLGRFGALTLEEEDGVESD